MGANETEGRFSDYAAPRGHLPELDGLRGLAVGLVMVHHFFQLGRMVERGPLEKAARLLANAGWCGVDLFFVLSGFLITGILYDARGRAGYFTTFYARRVLRIFPLYYAFLALYFGLLPLVLPAEHFPSWGWSNQLWQWTYLTNYQIALTDWQGTPSHLRHFWSLAIEEQFYMVWPLAVFTLARPALLRLCGFIVIGSLGLRVLLHTQGYWVASYVLTPTRMDALAMGAALALLVRAPHHHAAALRWAKRLLPLALLWGLGTMLWRKSLWREDLSVGTIGYTLVAAGFASLLLLSLHQAPQAPLPRALRSAPLQWLGKYSYALYVFHQPLAIALPVLGFSAATAPGAQWSPLLGQLVFSSVVLGLTSVSALVSWNLLEAPLLRLKSRFEYGGARSPEEPVNVEELSGASE